MDLVYVPTYTTGNCAYIHSSDVIRVYDSQPRQNSTIGYKDYYIKNSYIYNTGSTTFSQYTTLPTCIADSRITTDYINRVDFANILFIALAFIFVGYFFVSKIVRTLFVDWRYA